MDFYSKLSEYLGNEQNVLLFGLLRDNPHFTLNIKFKDGLTPLASAILSKNETAVELLLSAGADPNMTVGKDNFTPLMRSCYDGNYFISKILLEYGADIKKQDINGRTAMNICMVNQHLHISLLLIEKGGDCKDFYLVAKKNENKADMVVKTFEKICIEISSPREVKISGNDK